MNIARLLSPCQDASPSPTPLESSGSADHEEIGSPVPSGTTTTPSDLTAIESQSQQQQLVLFDATQRSTRAYGQRRAPRHQTATPTASLLVKRKRKRRFSAQQKQVMRENEEDDSLVYNLTLDVNELKQQVRDLLVRKSIIETRTLVSRQRFDAGVLRTTQQFFQVLQNGFREWRPQEDAFLTATLDEDVAIGLGVRGSDVFFKQWRRYSKLLQVHSVTTTSIRVISSDSESCVVKCKGEFEGRLTLAAIEAVFPHILKDTELLDRFVNSRLVCPRTVFLYFDAGGRIIRYDAHADMFAALNHILATNLQDVITLMANAHISSDGSLIPDLEEDDARVEVIDDTADDLQRTDNGAIK